MGNVCSKGAAAIETSSINERRFHHFSMHCHKIELNNYITDSILNLKTVKVMGVYSSSLSVTFFFYIMIDLNNLAIGHRNSLTFYSIKFPCLGPINMYIYRKRKSMNTKTTLKMT